GREYRLKSEYDVEVQLASVACSFARWVTRDDGAEVDLEELRQSRVGMVVVDVRERPVILFEGDWQLRSAAKYLPPHYVLSETAHGVVTQK
ncbi:MAG: peptide chain release factor 3, partial [Deltaproteobacteria bacterium]|nr:peptide chain release factor 3 [Deltaproteobacteria bacterium]